MSVRLISITSDAEKTMAYIARVSNVKNQDNENIEKLLKYCIDHKHWSVFEHAFCTVEIVTSRCISSQIIRHRSFTFSEFSQRYADVQSISSDMFEMPVLRLQDHKNRQNSLTMEDETTQKFYQERIQQLYAETRDLYNEMLMNDLSKESARYILPLATVTKMYMSGSIRSWIHYLEVRCEESTQAEHREIANLIKDIFVKELPIISKALNLS